MPLLRAMPRTAASHGRDGFRLQTMHRLARRSTGTLSIIPVVVVVLIAAFCVALVFWRRIQKRRQVAKAEHRRLYGLAPNGEPLETAQQQEQSLPLQQTTPRTRRGNAAASSRNAAARTQNTAAVDRQTSVRSVMTLPAYSVMASKNERILGRAGERDGIDIIVDVATEEQEEELRDEEMETLYQIREARRRQIAEREGRPAGRRAANNDPTVQRLQQQVSDTRERRVRSVSSVSYADLGVARHDGSRVDVSTMESENTGLLSDAASIGRASRDMTAPGRHRATSTGSFVSVDSGIPSPAYPGSRSSSRVDVSRTTTREAEGPGSSPEMVEADLGEEHIPPPEYEEVSLSEGHAPPRYMEDGSDELHAPEAGRQRSSSQVGPVPEIVIGTDHSGDMGENSSRR